MVTVNNLTSFEVLAQPVAPGLSTPIVQQGTFIQISNLSTVDSTISLNFTPSPAFVKEDLLVDYIDNSGNVTVVSATTFLTAPFGFNNISIPAGGTYIFGVQYAIPTTSPSSSPTSRATSDSGVAVRGYVTLSASTGSSLLVTATIRQVFYNYVTRADVTFVLDVSEAAYALPLINGPLQQF
jgi:hypothetical protein